MFWLLLTMCLATLTPSSSATDIEEKISRRECIGPTKLWAYKPDLPAEEWTHSEFHLREGPEEVEITAARVSRRYRYCPDSFTMMFGNECSRFDGFAKLTEEDIRTAESGMCRVGSECNIDTCAGSHSLHCQSDTRDNVVAPRPLRWPGGELKMVRFSCVQAWGCEVRKYTVSPHGKEDFSGFKIRGLAGEDLRLAQFQQGKDGWAYRMSSWAVKEKTVNLTCIGENPHRLCKYKESPAEYMLLTKGRGRERNFILESTQSRDKADGWGDLSSPATMDELKHSLAKIIFSDLKSKHNLLKILDLISSIQRQLLLLGKGDKEAAATEALGGGHVAVDLGPSGYIVCPGNPNAQPERGSALNVLDTKDIILQDISAQPVVDDALKSEIYEALVIREEGKNVGGQKSDITLHDGFSITWLTKELLYTVGSICGIIALIRR